MRNFVVKYICQSPLTTTSNLVVGRKVCLKKNRQLLVLQFSGIVRLGVIFVCFFVQLMESLSPKFSFENGNCQSFLFSLSLSASGYPGQSVLPQFVHFSRNSLNLSSLRTNTEFSVLTRIKLLVHTIYHIGISTYLFLV